MGQVDQAQPSRIVLNKNAAPVLESRRGTCSHTKLRWLWVLLAWPPTARAAERRRTELRPPATGESALRPSAPSTEGLSKRASPRDQTNTNPAGTGQAQQLRGYPQGANP